MNIYFISFNGLYFYVFVILFCLQVFERLKLYLGPIDNALIEALHVIWWFGYEQFTEKNRITPLRPRVKLRI